MARCSRCGLRLRQGSLCAAHGSASSDLPTSAQADGLPDGRWAVPGYTELREIGRGGFGVVCAALRKRDGLPVALKVALSSEPVAIESLHREADALEAVGPPHVPAVYERGLVDGLPYLALELIEAPTLADVLAEAAGPLPTRRIAELAGAILPPLAAIHARGYAHFDLKPENIFVMANAQSTRIIDLGLARHSGERPREVAATSEEAIGTAEYMSPEQCAGWTDFDFRSDIYSLGVILYEMVCGHPPFWGVSADVREAQISRRPRPPRFLVRCEARLSDLIIRCLAKNPAHRPGAVSALDEALRAALTAQAGASGRPAASGTPSTSPPPAAAKDREGRPSAPQRQKRAVSLVFLETTAHGLSAVKALSRAGGQIVYAASGNYIAVFDLRVGHNPARQALTTARALVSSNLAERCLVDVATILVQGRPDGEQRLFSSLFSGKRFPLGGPTGLMLTRNATEVLTDLPVSEIAGDPTRVKFDTTATLPGGNDLTAARAPLVGRDAQLAELLKGANHCFASREPTLVAVAAESGYGLTHLAWATSQALCQGDVPEVMMLSPQADAPGQLVPRLLRHALGLPEGAPSDGGRALLIERLGAELGAQGWAAAAFALGWVDANHEEVALLLSATGALRFAIARAAGEALRLRARTRPLAILVDDAHLADEVALDAIEYASMREAECPIWACVFVPPHFFASRRTWALRATHSARYDLGPLDPDAAAELTRRLLQPVEYASPQVLARLAERAQRIPRLLVELVSGLKREGLIRRYEQGAGYYLATDELDRLPDVPVLQWNTIRQIKALPPELAAHAQLCAVLAGNLGRLEMEALLQRVDQAGLAPELRLDAMVGLQRLVEAGVLVRLGPDRFDFRNALLRDMLVTLIPESQRLELHREAFEVYRAIDMPEAERLPKYALHASRCGKTALAATAYLALAERAQRTQNYLDAEASYSLALQHIPASDDPGTVCALGERGRVRFRLGRHEDALKDLRRARELSRSLDQPERAAELSLDEATVLDLMRDVPQSTELVRQAEALVRAPEGLLALKLAVGRVRIHSRRGELETSMRLGAEVVAEAVRYGEAGYEPRIVALSMVTFDAVLAGHLDEAERYFEVMIDEAQAHADLLHLSAAYSNRVVLWFERGDMDRFAEDCARAIRCAREAGSPLLEWAPVTNRAQLAYFLGETGTFEAQCARAIELGTHLWGEDALELIDVELLQARQCLHRAALDEASRLARSVRARLGRHDGAAAALLPSESVLLEMVELGARGAQASDWNALEDRASASGVHALEQLELLETRALSAYRHGRTGESFEVFERALRLAREKPNALGDRVEREVSELFGPQQGPDRPTDS